MKLAAVLLTLSLPALAADWPQWRGPNRDESSTETGLLKQWPASGPKSVWVFENAGQGYSGFAVAAGKLFTLGTRDGKEILLALDANTGKELWASPIGDILGNGWGDGPRSSPTVDGDRVYALAGKGNLVCAQVTDGKVLWTKSMHDLGGKTPGWGYSESPLVDGKLVARHPRRRQGHRGGPRQNDRRARLAERRHHRGRAVFVHHPRDHQRQEAIRAARDADALRRGRRDGQTHLARALVRGPHGGHPDAHREGRRGLHQQRLRRGLHEGESERQRGSRRLHEQGSRKPPRRRDPRWRLPLRPQQGRLDVHGLDRRQREVEGKGRARQRRHQPCRRDVLLPRRKERQRRAHRGVAEGLERERALQTRSAVEHPQPEGRHLDAPRHRERQAVSARPESHPLLRREDGRRRNPPRKTSPISNP